MRYTTLPLIAILLLSTILTTACPGPEQKNFYASVQDIYLDLEENQYNPENPGQETWPYSYHMMLYAAWVQIGKTDIDSDYEDNLRAGGDTYWELYGEIERQIDAGYDEFNEDELFGIIEDEQIRESALEYYHDHDISPLAAYTRAFGDYIESTLDPNFVVWAPNYAITLLGRLYTERPDLCDNPQNTPAEDEDSRWRDWLQNYLSSSEARCSVLIDWNRQISTLQELVPDEPFWDGRLTHAFTLRSLQRGGAFSLKNLMLHLQNARLEGRSVSGFLKWAYWNLAYTAYAGNSIAPYTDEDITEINTFLIEGLKTGGTNIDEEAWIVADALGRAPAPYYAEQLFDIIDDENTSCELRQLCYTSLGNMFYVDPNSWLPDLTQREYLKDRAVDMMASPDTSCGVIPVMDLYKGVTRSFYPYLYGEPLDWELDHDDFVKINEAFRGMTPEFVTTEERVRAIDLLLTKIGQPDFLIFYDNADDYHSFLMELHTEWSESTDLEGSDMERDDVENLLRLFRNSLGNWDLLERYTEEYAE